MSPVVYMKRIYEWRKRAYCRPLQTPDEYQGTISNVDMAAVSSPLLGSPRPSLPIVADLDGKPPDAPMRPVLPAKMRENVESSANRNIVLMSVLSMATHGFASVGQHEIDGCFVDFDSLTKMTFSVALLDRSVPRHKISNAACYSRTKSPSQNMQ